MLRILLVLLGVIVLLHALLWLLQDRFIYFPRHYPFAPEQLPPPFTALRYTTADGPQLSIYLPPKDPALETLWIVFGGNAMTALDWSDWAMRHPDRHAGFLLMDYPGYGFNGGSPSHAGIRAACDAAFAAMAAQLGQTPEALFGRTRLLGHSLGAAAALEFAGHHPVRGVVLTAPFSRLSDVAAVHYGPSVRWLVRNDYDNLAALAQLDAERPSLVILHGQEDEIIPFALGERLARSAPWVRFVPVAGGHHNDLYQVAPEQIRREMLDAR